MKFKKSLMLVFTLLALTFSAVGVKPAYALTFPVTNNADSGAGSLRQAIIDAEIAAPGPNTIAFTGNYTITLLSQLPVVTTIIIVNGNGAANTIVQASTCNPVTLPGACAPAGYRVFEVGATGDLTLNSLTVRNGSCAGACATDANNGGGAYNLGLLTITNSAFSANTATNGGGVYNMDPATLTVTNSTFSGNSATTNGGGISNVDFTTLASAVTNSTFSGNSAANGGGVYNGAGSALTITDSAFSGNSATINGGGVYNSTGTTLPVAGSTFSGNSATANGGGLFNLGAGAGFVTVAGSTFSGNSAANGGGAYNDAASTLDVITSTFSGNSATKGGGVYNLGGVTFTDTTFSNNSATANGGGGYNDVAGTLTSLVR